MSDYQEKTIIDLCGGTGAWSKPYSDAGYNVLNITHPGSDVMTWEGYKELPTVHGVIAAPTCTMFSLARTTAKTPRDLEGGFELVQRCLDIVKYCRFHRGLKFWALENPTSYLRQILGKPPLTFNPKDYGANYTKRTDLWGYYNIPKKTPRVLTEDEKARCSINNRKLPKLPDGYKLPTDFKPQQARRSMTDEHFALAFFKANR